MPDYRMLSQGRPDSTNAVTLYTVPTLRAAVISSYVVANSTASAATYRFFIDDDADDFDQDVALAYDVSIAANTSAHIDCGTGWFVNPDYLVGVRSGTASALTFTLFGLEVVA